jgi:hypothetical protein
MSRFTRHSLIGLPEPLPDSPGGATQEGVVRKVFALRRCAPVPGCAGLGRCAPCRPLPSRPCGAPAGYALGAAPTGRWPPPPGAAARAGKCLSRLPGTGSLRSACVRSGRCPLASLDRRACGPAPASGQGGNALARPRSGSGAGALPPPQHAPLSLRSQLAAFMRRLPQRPAACTGLRPNPQTAPALSLRSQLAGCAGGRLPLPADRSGDRPATSACGSAWPGAWWPVPPTGSAHEAAETGRLRQCGACIS